MCITITSYAEFSTLEPRSHLDDMAGMEAVPFDFMNLKFITFDLYDTWLYP